MLTVSAVRAQAIDGVTFQVPATLASHQSRVKAATGAALTLLDEWFGALPSKALAVTATRWQGVDQASARPGEVSVPVRWLAPVRDQAMERALISGVVQQYWLDESPSKPFQDAVVAYLSVRAIHHILEGSNFEAPRFFGGHVSFPLRSMLLSPPVGDPRPRVWIFGDEQPRPEQSTRLRALQTIERVIGWPTLLQAISSMRAAGPSQWTISALGERTSAITGIDLRALVQECFSKDVDYSLTGLDSRAVSGGMSETTLVIADRGAFAASIPVLVRFADGATFRDTFNGGATSGALTLVYTAKSPAVSASIDPETMLLLDTNRENNTIVHGAPTSRLGVRLALHWLGWLQNAMLSYTAVL